MGKKYLKEIEDAKLAPEQCVTGFGTTLIVAPHADDESLGCGGIISLLTKYNQTVYILLVSDGTLSHPNSKEYPAEKLRDLREEEFKNAANILNVPEENLIFCRYQDRNVPHQNDGNFVNAAAAISKLLNLIKPESIFVPWRRDPHPDHRASYQLIKKANHGVSKIYEYPIWLEELGSAEDAPKTEEGFFFKVDITNVLTQKREAIFAHKSQTTQLISDDPAGFMLSSDMLTQFDIPYETFFTSK